MKRFLVIIAGILAVSSISTLSVNAADVEMTPGHVARIRANCVEAQSVLQRVHVSDALLRVNRGQLYEQMTTKLMSPLNSRISLNRLDGTELSLTSSDYERQLDSFRKAYMDYEETMSDALAINCADKPVSFYDLVTETRNKREKVHQETLQLNRIISRYGVQFDAFSKYVKERSR